MLTPSEHKRIQREAAASMAAQGFPVTCQGVRYGGPMKGKITMEQTLYYDGAPRPITEDEAQTIAHDEHKLVSSYGQHHWYSRGADGGMHLRETFTRSQAAIVQINTRRKDLREKIMAGRATHTIFYDRARDAFYCG